MALEAGELTLSLEYGHNLKDKDWFGKQDPYCIIQLGSQTQRSKTAKDGGKNPVWNQSFKFNVINENNFTLRVMDEDTGGDDTIGEAIGQLAKVRLSGTDRQEIAIISKKSGKQNGHLLVALSFAKNSMMGAPPPGQYGQPMPYGMQPQGYAPQGYAPPYGMPPQGYAPQYGMPPQGYAPQPYGAPQYGAPQYGAPPPGQYGAPPPQGQYPPQQGYPPQQQQGYPPQQGAPPAHGAPPPGRGI